MLVLVLVLVLPAVCCMSRQDTTKQKETNTRGRRRNEPTITRPRETLEAVLDWARRLEATGMRNVVALFVALAGDGQH